jgi:hypothetical protein
MATYKRGKIYWYKFMWQGKLIRESTKQKNDKVARQMEAAHHTSLAKGEVGIREKKPAPFLKEFLKDDFLPFAKMKRALKPLTYRYYKQGTDMLLKSAMTGLRLDELTDQHAQGFAAKYSSMSASGINRGLRTLRRALNLAYQWKKLERAVKVGLAEGEHQRDRVLTDQESDAYISRSPADFEGIEVNCAPVPAIASECVRRGFGKY